MHTLNYHCPHCDAPIRFDETAQAMVCAYCGSTFDPLSIERSYEAAVVRLDQEADALAAEAEAGAEGGQSAHAGGRRLTWGKTPEQRFLERAPWARQDASDLREFVCSSCGAVLVLDRTAAASSCPYCSNATVMRGMLAGPFTPDSIAPFEISEEQATAAIRAHVDKLLVPKAFKRQLHVQHAAGIYVPFWLYSAELSGPLTFQLAHKRGSFRMEEVVIERGVDVFCAFDHVPVVASTKMPDGYMDALEPFDTDKLVPFAGSFLSGFFAECRDQDAWDCKNRAITRMSNTVSRKAQQHLEDTSAIYEQSPCERCMPDTSSMAVSWGAITCALLPVWMMHATWEGEDYLLAMNGQTGKMSSRLPLSSMRRNALFGSIFAVTGLAALAAIVAMWGGVFALDAQTSHSSVGMFRSMAMITAFIAVASYAIPSIITFKQMQRLKSASKYTTADAQVRSDVRIQDTGSRLVNRWKYERWGGDKFERVAAHLRRKNAWKVDVGRESFAALRPDVFADGKHASQQEDLEAIPAPRVYSCRDRRIDKLVGMHWRDAVDGWRRNV